MIRTGVGLGSGNTDLLEILLSGSDVWNQWRMENPDTQINLSNADLRNTDLRNTDLRNTDLRDTDLRDTNLRFANLRSATISEETKMGAALST